MQTILESFFSEISNVLKRLRNFDPEFERMKLNFDNFNLNKEMVVILMPSGNDRMLPFADVFNKHVANLKNLYQATQNACGILLENSDEMKDRITKLEKDLEESLNSHAKNENTYTIKNLSLSKDADQPNTVAELIHKTEESAARIQELKKQLFELMSEMNRHKENSMLNCDEIEHDKSTIHHQKNIMIHGGDFDESSDSVEAINQRKSSQPDSDWESESSISNKEQLDSASRYLDRDNELLTHSLNLQESQHDEYKTNENRNHQSFSKRQKRGREKQQSEGSIDTLNLIRTLKKVTCHKISHRLFAEEVLGISRGTFAYLISKTKPWNKCTSSQKRIFEKIKSWLASPEAKKTVDVLNLKQKKSFICEYMPIDTFELADRTKELLIKLRITLSEFAITQKTSLTVITSMLDYPEPWKLLSMLKKNQYRRMHRWLVNNEDPFLQLEEASDVMNTTEVAASIISILNKYEITFSFFAKKLINISTVYFEQLVNEPRPWREMHESQRRIFSIIEKWTLASSEMLDSLRSECLDCNLNMQYHNSSEIITIEN